ncbi:MAG: PLD nuclease N-terminal domain-containing protein [archaeon]
MRKLMIVLAAAFLLLSSVAFADMMDWGWGSGMMAPGMMGWWPFGIGWGVFGVFVTILWILAFVFWIWMLVDVVTRRFDDNIEKLVWVLVIIFANIIGALIYYFIIKAGNRSSAVMRRPVPKK